MYIYIHDYIYNHKKYVIPWRCAVCCFLQSFWSRPCLASGNGLTGSAVLARGGSTSSHDLWTNTSLQNNFKPRSNRSIHFRLNFWQYIDNVTDINIIHLYSVMCIYIYIFFMFVSSLYHKLDLECLVFSFFFGSLQVDELTHLGVDHSVIGQHRSCQGTRQQQCGQDLEDVS